MKGSTTQPKVFISYSWTSPQHEQWVIGFAERLSSDGIFVVLDKWDLKEGQDKHKFMERMVHEKTINKVLVVCDRGYQTKADDRQGGVGTESQLISKEVYEHTEQEKFIPIVTEYDQEGKPCIPHFMASRIYINLAQKDTFEDNYQQLIRNLYDKPLLKRPPIGTPPVYVTEEEGIQLQTSQKIVAIKDALTHDKKSGHGLISDFLDTFVSSLEHFRISGGGEANFDDKVIATIEQTLPLRNEFLEFASSLFKYSESVDLDQLHEFLEKLISFTIRPETVHSWSELDFDNYRVFNYDLMLNFVTILLKFNRYREAGEIINAQYFYRNSTWVLTHGGIEMLNRPALSLEQTRNQRLGLWRVSVTADLVKARATYPEIRFKDIQQTDLILYYITELKGERFGWFPRTSAYGDRGSGIDVFDRMISERHFDKVKSLFAVQSADELKARVREYVERRNASQLSYAIPWDYDIRPLENMMDAQKIGTVR